VTLVDAQHKPDCAADLVVADDGSPFIFPEVRNTIQDPDYENLVWCGAFLRADIPGVRLWLTFQFSTLMANPGGREYKEKERPKDH
jgi:hypothetical protein